MKRIIFLTIVILTLTEIKAQKNERIVFGTTIGTGLAISEPSSTPFIWQVQSLYKFNTRLSAGIGTGLSFYEKTLIPLYTDIKFNVTKPRKLIPYLECAVGYSWAPDKNSNGGFYLNPSIGVQYTICNTQKLLLAIGYEQQKYERLKRYENPYLTAEFREQLHHHSISVKVGFLF